MPDDMYGVLVNTTQLDNAQTATASAIRSLTGSSDSLEFDLSGETGFRSALMDISIPEPADQTPSDLGTAAVGSSTKYAREDHVHNKPTYTASDVGAATPPKYITLTLAVADWESSGNAYACSKTVMGMTATSIVWLEYSDTKTEFTEAQSANTLTFGVAALPSTAITVNVAFMEGSALS